MRRKWLMFAEEPSRHVSVSTPRHGEAIAHEPVPVVAVGRSPSVARCRLQSCRSDRLARGGVGQVGVEAHLVQQLRQPRPSIRRLDHYRRPRLEADEHIAEPLDIVRDVPVNSSWPSSSSRSELRAPTMDIQPHVHHHGLPSIDNRKASRRRRAEARPTHYRRCPSGRPCGIHLGHRGVPQEEPLANAAVPAGHELGRCPVRVVR